MFQEGAGRSRADSFGEIQGGVGGGNGVTLQKGAGSHGVTCMLSVGVRAVRHSTIALKAHRVAGQVVT